MFNNKTKHRSLKTVRLLNLKNQKNDKEFLYPLKNGMRFSKGLCGKAHTPGI